MEIKDWYQRHFEEQLLGRYVTLKHINPLLNSYKNKFQVSIIGTSEFGKDIPMIKVGEGAKTVLGWSQMHGNESTTTKAIFDFLKFIYQQDDFQIGINRFLKEYTFYIIPILNPDGAELYTRENANAVDLNRDAQLLSQKESQFLRAVFEEVKPELCLNLHDQRSIYGFANGNPATVSFLSPAADIDRSITLGRKTAMEYIIKMNKELQKYIPGEVGRYDDSFNEACVGDTFQMTGVPTILFEAGHSGQDYQREKTREYVFYALLTLFDVIDNSKLEVDYNKYFSIPENSKNFKDIIARNLKIGDVNQTVSVAVQFSEVLHNGNVEFVPKIEEIGNLSNAFGHSEKDFNGTHISTDSQKKLSLGNNISINIDEKGELMIYFQGICL